MSREAARWTVEDLLPAHAPETLALFEAAFGQPLPEAVWHWRYGAGRGISIGARDRSGALVAHYGGTIRDAYLHGERISAIQAGDVMVHPAVRGILTRHGPFFLCAERFCDRHVGFGKPHLIAYGFPSSRALRLGERHGLYARVDSILEVCWRGPAALPFWLDVRPLDWQAARTSRWLDRLWRRMRTSLTDCIVLSRDARWWRWRYHDHPEQPYRACWIWHRVLRRPVGAFVVRPGDERWELLDWIAPRDAARLAVAGARALAAREGVQAVTGWFSGRVAALVETADATVTDIGVGVPTSVQSPGPAPDVLRGTWWLTGGDTDFR